MIILFDLDGTLIDSTPAILESFHEAYKAFNTPVPSDEEIKKLIGLPLDIMFEKLGIPSDEKWDYVNAYKKHYRPISKQKTTLLPFAKEAIIEASKIADLGIVTTKTARYSEELMDHFGVLKYFKVLIGREDVQNPKPHPEPILKALNILGYRLDKKAYMIGDTCLDSISAKEAGIIPIAVHSGYGDKIDLHNCTDIVLENALEAVKYLSKL
jgi:phosphoglycolate phosphatase